MKIDLSKDIGKIVDEYRHEVVETTNEAQKVVAQECVQKLKNTSPRRAGGGKHYANGWKSSRKTEAGGISKTTIYNKSKPQLTHLLEKGHIIKNAYGEYGRVEGIEHIAPVDEYAADKLPEEIERKLK